MFSVLCRKRSFRRGIGAPAEAKGDRRCNVCEKALTGCADGDHGHRCDVCGKTLSGEGDEPARKSTGVWIAGIAGGAVTPGPRRRSCCSFSAERDGSGNGDPRHIRSKKQ